MLQTVLDGARESGHELEPVFLEPGPWPEELRAAGLRVEVLAAGRLRDVHRWVATVVALARLMRRRRPDVILNWSAKTQLYGAPAAVLAGMRERVVWWQHAIQDGHWLDRCATALPARAIGCSSQTTADAQARLRPARATFVVAPGTRVPDGGVSAPPGSRAPGVASAPPGSRAPDRGAPAPLALPEGVPVVGLVGRLEPWKGQDRLLQAHALLREEGRRLYTVIVGGDAYDLSPEYARSIPALVRRLGLDGEVTLTGQVPDAGPYIERMDVLVNASEGEPFGIVLIEGMARGVAVVAVDAGGPAELIEDGRTGVLARSGEPRALADALAPLLDSPARRRELGAAGRERFAREFTDAAMRARFFASLEQHIGGPVRRGAAVAGGGGR